MIDWNRVNELYREIGEEDFAEVVELFLDEVQQVTEKLRHQPDPLDLEADLHFLKGCALNLGFEKFAVKCHAGERLAANGNHEQVNITALLDLFEKSKVEFVGQWSARCAA